MTTKSLYRVSFGANVRRCLSPNVFDLDDIGESKSIDVTVWAKSHQHAADMVASAIEAADEMNRGQR